MCKLGRPLAKVPCVPWWLWFEAWSLGCWDHTVVQGTTEMKHTNHFGRLYSKQFHSVTVYQGLLQVSEWCEQANRHDILHGIGKELKHEHTFGHILPSWLGDCPLLCCQNAVSWWRSSCRLMKYGTQTGQMQRLICTCIELSFLHRAACNRFQWQWWAIYRTGLGRTHQLPQRFWQAMGSRGAAGDKVSHRDCHGLPKKTSRDSARKVAAKAPSHHSTSSFHQRPGKLWGFDVSKYDKNFKGATVDFFM